MVLTMMPMATGVAWASTTPIESVTFGYAYDAQRTPTFPSEEGCSIEMWDLARPLIGDQETNRVDSYGNWKLTKVGTYSYISSTTLSGLTSNYLNGIVSSVASEYSLTDEQKQVIVVHELKKGDTHIAYGVVIAYDAENGNAVFIGDHWGNSGACYLLSKSEIDNCDGYTAENPFTITAGEIATDFVQELSISLDTSGTYTFDPADFGYSAPPCKEVTVLNNGNGSTGDLTVSLSDPGAEYFEFQALTDGKITSIGTDNRTKTFSVQPKIGLRQGTYTATVTVSGTDIDPQSFNVSFTVNKAPLSSIAVTNAPTKTTYTAGENFNTAGMVVTATYSDNSTAAVIGYTVTDGTNLTAGKTSVTISYTEGDVTEETTQPITVNAPSSGGSYTPTIQKPTVIADEGAETTLSILGTKLTIKVTDGYELADVILNGVSKGKVTELTGLKTGDKVEVKTEKKQEEPKEPTKEEIIAALDSSKLVARSKLITLKNGKKAVRITWYDKNGKEVDFDGIEIYRSTQRYKGYGLKPFYATKDVKTEGYYVNTKDLKEGTTYYYKVRGYIEIDGQKYYTDYSLKAIRTVK